MKSFEKDFVYTYLKDNENGLIFFIRKLVSNLVLSFKLFLTNLLTAYK